MRKRWDDLGIQAVIAPIYPHCAFKTSNSIVSNCFLDYSIVWNLLHYPVGFIPITSIEESETKSEAYEDGGHNDKWSRTIRDDMEGSTGMPVGVQVVGLSHQDEAVLGVMKALDNGIGFKKYAQMD